MAISFEEESLPEVIVDPDSDGNYSYVKVGEWSFCVEDDLEHEDWWESAKALISYAMYLDKIKAEQGV